MSNNTIADKLQDLIDAKADMKDAIAEKGVEVEGGLVTYADAIMKIDTTSYLPIGTKFANTTFGVYSANTDRPFGYSYTAQDAINLLNPEETDMSYMFYRATISAVYSNESHITNFDTSKVTDMSYMFSRCCLDKIPNIDTSNVRYMRHMFENVNRYENSSAEMMPAEIPDLDYSSVVDITNFFADDAGYYAPNIPNMCKFINLGKQPDLIGTDSFGFLWWRRLSRAEYLRIVSSLYDRAAAGYGFKRIRLSSGTINNLSDVDIALAINKGWALIS